ncbi:MAG: TraR/DksA family transcriptional regulator [Comamonadaceae bacterium]|nr:MAG: TraR/DksA family transcriptional regulator [Comamonadaceae bacterium]
MPSILDTTPAARNPAARLRERAEELRRVLQAAAGAAISGEHAEVVDFKDVAAEDTRAAVDEVAQTLAADELAQVMAALRRVDDGSYGLCEDCGERIDERRLLALPATAYCTACQAIHERPALARR